MKIVKHNISPLPFYDDIAQQNHRKDYAFGQIYPLIVRRNELLPFQVVLSSSVTRIAGVRLISLSDGKSVDISSSIIGNGLKLITKSGYKILKYPGILPIPEIKQEGQYYLQVNVVAGNSVSLYSDIFVSTNTVDGCIKLTYSNNYSFYLKGGEVDFSDNFKFICYLKSQIGKPEYSFEEEATERMGYTFVESQVSKKIYKFVFVAPEYLCDALRIVRLCDTKEISDRHKDYDLITFTVNPSWEEQGDLASVECEFETDTVITNLGGNRPEELGGEFNNDYNNDYKKS